MGIKPYGKHQGLSSILPPRSGCSNNRVGGVQPLNPSLNCIPNIACVPPRARRSGRQIATTAPRALTKYASLLASGRDWCRSCLAGRHLVYVALLVFSLSTSQTRIAPARPLGVGDTSRSLSIAATSALTGNPVSSEAAFSISQNNGSRLIEV